MFHFNSIYTRCILMYFYLLYYTYTNIVLLFRLFIIICLCLFHHRYTTENSKNCCFCSFLGSLYYIYIQFFLYYNEHVSHILIYKIDFVFIYIYEHQQHLYTNDIMYVYVKLLVYL